MESQIEFTSLQYLGTYNLRDSSLSIPWLRWQLKLLFYVHPYLGFHDPNLTTVIFFRWVGSTTTKQLFFWRRLSSHCFPRIPRGRGQESGFRQLRQLRWCRGFFVSGWMAIEQLWTQVIPHRKLTWPMEKNACLILILIGNTSSNWFVFFSMVVFVFVFFFFVFLRIFLGSGMSTATESNSTPRKKRLLFKLTVWCISFCGINQHQMYVSKWYPKPGLSMLYFKTLHFQMFWCSFSFTASSRCS